MSLRTKIKIEKDVIYNMSYDDLVSYIKRGFDFKFAVGNNIEISIFNYSLNKDDHFPKTSVLCYSLIENNERIDIVDIIFNKDEIETIEIYKYMTLKDLYNDEHFKILELF